MKTRLWAYMLAGLLAFGCGGGDSGGGVNEPPAGATVSGVVREQGSGNPVVGAAVKLGSVATTSGQNGEFELRNVPAGAALDITVSAPGYDAFTQSVNVQSGSNNLTLTIVRNGLYDAGVYTLYLPPNVATYRGVFVVMYGGDVDTSPLVKGNLAPYQGLPLNGDVAGYRQRMLEFAQAQGIAVMGGMFNASELDASNYVGILNALTSVATQSRHPELATLPLILHGHSARGCIPYYFAKAQPNRTIGFITAKTGCNFGSAGGAASVPGYFFFGQNDPQVSQDAVNQTRVFFEQNRAAGAPWAFAIEPLAGHAQVEDHQLLFDWMSAVVAVRLAPATATVRPVTESAGWLGELSSYAIAGYACFPGNKANTSWLPSEQTARGWQAFVSRSSVTVVTAC